MDLLIVLFVLALIGYNTWLITEFIPMDPPFKTGIKIVAAVVMILYLFRTFGSSIPNVL